jgi:hypothetical protein
MSISESVTKPEDLVLTCTFNPPPHPRVRGHLICMHHPAKIELMDPDRYGERVEDDEDDEDDDEGEEDDDEDDEDLELSDADRVTLEEEEWEKYGPDADEKE